MTLWETVTESATGEAAWPPRAVQLRYEGTTNVPDRWGGETSVHNFSFPRVDWSSFGQVDLATYYYFDVRSGLFISRHNPDLDRTFFAWIEGAVLPEGFGSAVSQYEAAIFLFFLLDVAGRVGEPFKVGTREYAFEPSDAPMANSDCTTYELRASPALQAAYDACLDVRGVARAVRSRGELTATYELRSGTWPQRGELGQAPPSPALGAEPWSETRSALPGQGWTLWLPPGDPAGHVPGIASAIQTDPSFHAFASRNPELYVAHALWTERDVLGGRGVGGLMEFSEGVDHFLGGVTGRAISEEQWVYAPMGRGSWAESGFPIDSPLVRPPWWAGPPRDALPARVVGLSTIQEHYGDAIPGRDLFLEWRVTSWTTNCAECAARPTAPSTLAYWIFVEDCDSHDDARFAIFSAVNGQWLLTGLRDQRHGGCPYRTPG